jgi:hypothetical protein
MSLKSTVERWSALKDSFVQVRSAADRAWVHSRKGSARPLGGRSRGVLHQGDFDIRANWLTCAMLAAISGGRLSAPLYVPLPGFFCGAWRGMGVSNGFKLFQADEWRSRRPDLFQTVYRLLQSVSEPRRGGVSYPSADAKHRLFLTGSMLGGNGPIFGLRKPGNVPSVTCFCPIHNGEIKGLRRAFACAIGPHLFRRPAKGRNLVAAELI